MGTLTFQWDEVRSLMRRTETTPPKNRRLVWGDLCTPAYFKPDVPKGTDMVESGDQLDPEKIPLGLVFVGDDGIYLMSGDSSDRTVLYASECNPKSMPFEEWWEAKERLFGGDDGAERIELASLLDLEARLAASPLKDVPPGQLMFRIRLSDRQMSFGIEARHPMRGSRIAPRKRA
ncbi:MAG: DUF3085 domain-containing protein [Sinobacteraceae bacterium]|nr:DUF3085 domain-containing protein [Nevskiaceae bacterium]